MNSSLISSEYGRGSRVKQWVGPLRTSYWNLGTIQYFYRHKLFLFKKQEGTQGGSTPASPSRVHEFLRDQYE